jgi:redox-sensitive bicupin YhaK (pirin superfamily)
MPKGGGPAARSITMKKIESVLTSQGGHWVGDGFPVRSLFSYDREAQENSPFLLFDYAGPYNFLPAQTPRGVGQHPHRGFETVTIAYEGEVAHRDSTGGGGTIKPGDVQWMTAAGGIIHEEFHSPAFTRTGGPFRMVQLWVNLPAKDKMTKAGYQGIASDVIPVVTLPGGTARIIAGEFGDAKGPARTFSPINLWDVRLQADADVTLDLPEGHTAMVAVLSGHVTVDGTGAGEAEILRFTREGAGAQLHADGDAVLLVMTGEPLGEPVVGHGPFVMTSTAEIHQAIDDFNSGRFGTA